MATKNFHTARFALMLALFTGCFLSVTLLVKHFAKSNADLALVMPHSETARPIGSRGVVLDEGEQAEPSERIGYVTTEDVEVNIVLPAQTEEPPLAETAEPPLLRP